MTSCSSTAASMRLYQAQQERGNGDAVSPGRRPRHLSVFRSRADIIDDHRAFLPREGSAWITTAVKPTGCSPAGFTSSTYLGTAGDGDGRLTCRRRAGPAVSLVDLTDPLVTRTARNSCLKAWNSCRPTPGGFWSGTQRISADDSHIEWVSTHGDRWSGVETDRGKTAFEVNHEDDASAGPPCGRGDRLAQDPVSDS